MSIRRGEARSAAAIDRGSGRDPARAGPARRARPGGARQAARGEATLGAVGLSRRVRGRLGGRLQAAPHRRGRAHAACPDRLSRSRQELPRLGEIHAGDRPAGRPRRSLRHLPRLVDGLSPRPAAGHAAGHGLILDDPADFAPVDAARRRWRRISATSSSACRRRSRTRWRRWPPGRRRSAISASTSPSACPAGATTSAPRQPTVEALALLAAQPVEILIHSNLDDGFASLFHDLCLQLRGWCCSSVTSSRTLIGGRISHCYGHTFSEPLTRLAFQRALAATASTPGTMIYGNTTPYQGSGSDNYAVLGSYLMVDADRPAAEAVGPRAQPGAGDRGGAHSRTSTRSSMRTASPIA